MIPMPTFAPARERGACPLSHPVALIYSDAYQGYRVSPAHPFNPVRLRWTYEMIEELGLLAPGELRGPEPASDEDLLRVHASSYLQEVRRLSSGGAVRESSLLYGLGTEDDPGFPGMHEAAALAVGGTLGAARAVASGELLHAFNIGGGLHHAFAAQAAGFCIYNDIALGILALRDAGLKVAYIDIDVHHGDGVQEIFYRDPDVLTISFHESGRYLFPGTGGVDELGAGPGLGTSLNVPLEPFTDDTSWLELFEAIVPPALRNFRPDALVTLHGCDGHVLDPLADMRLTTRFYWRTAARLHELAHEVAGGRWLGLGGGGYELLRVVPRAWSLVWAEMRGTPLPEETPVPTAFNRRHQAPGEAPLPDLVVDPQGLVPPLDRQGEISGRNRATLARLRQISPLL
jgi:acetoin utilization protein AcuC